MFWVASLTLFAGFIMVLIAHGAIPDLRAEAQVDTRHATFPPGAEKVLVWHGGTFEMTCAESSVAKKSLTIRHEKEAGNAGYFVLDGRDIETSYAGRLSIEQSSRTADLHFLKTDINNTVWKSYGVAYTTSPLCEGGTDIFDFSVRGACDGSSINVTMSGPSKIVMSSKVSEHSGANYRVWCGYIPDDLDSVGNKIF